MRCLYSTHSKIFSKTISSKRKLHFISNGIVYIYGGKQDYDLSDELWKYDIGTNSYEYLSKGIRKINYPYCWLDSNLLYISLGSTRVEEPSAQIDIYNITSSKWSLFYNNSNLFTAQSSQIFISNRFISVGGQFWLFSVSNEILVLGPKNSTKNLILDKNYNIFGSGSIYFKKDLYVFGGGTVLGNSILQKTGNNKLIRTSIEDISKELGFDATCSPGTVVYGNTCRVCKAGTFSKEFNSLECIKCKPGSYNRSPGSTSEQQCLPCNYGTYTNSSGSKSCEICPKNYDCPLGSISPFKNSTVLVSESYQPQIYKQIYTNAHPRNPTQIFKTSFGNIGCYPRT